MNRFVVTNTALCIGCHTCEIACVSAHHTQGEVMESKNFFPRLKLMKKGDVTGPVMCRHCENAPCESVCPTGAITQGDGLVNVDQSKCIGCQSCVLGCPYGVMEVVTQDVPRIVNGKQMGLISKSEAQKCDLCSTRAAGPACVEVCPTKALSVVEPATLQKLRQDRQKAALSAML